jgi:hypothetical protein
MLLFLFVVWIGLCLLATVGAFFLQTSFNETPPEPKEVAWRGPAAGSLVAFYLLIWGWLATGNPDRHGAYNEFTTKQDLPYFDKMKVVIGRETFDAYKRHDQQGRPGYRYRTPNRQEFAIPSRPEAIIVTEGEETAKFVPEKDEKGKFILDGAGRAVYKDDRGRVMHEGYLGQITIYRTGWFLSYLLLNLFHFGVWLAAMWPILQFRFGMALLISVVAWLTTTLILIPPLATQARGVYDRRQKEKAMERPEARGEKKNGRENLAALPPVSGVRSDSPHEPVKARDRYFAATAGAKAMLTLTSSPARTVTRSVLVWPLNSAFRV